MEIYRIGFENFIIDNIDILDLNRFICREFEIYMEKVEEVMS